MSSTRANGGAPALPDNPANEDLRPSDVNRLLLEFFMYMGKAILIFYPVYLIGSLGMSISWILLSLVIWSLWEQNRKHKDIRIDTAIDFLENESCVIKTELKTLNMPAWINFSDVEKAAWMNKILHQAWPFFDMYMEKLLKDSIQATIRSSSVHLKTFTFTKVHFGQKAPTISGIRVYTYETDKREVILDLNIVYVGDLDIQANVKPHVSAGVKEIQLQGMLRVILEPLIGQAPLVGGITMFFIRRPTFHINWTGVTNLLDSPTLRPFSESAILDVIASLMVLPNRMCFPLIDQVKVDQMRFPLPRGVVRVHAIEAQDLVAMDTVMMGLVKGKSDPYVVLRVGNKRFQTKTIKETLSPRWNEVYEFVIHEAPGQELEVELYDEDKDKDDFMGRFNLDFGEVKKEKEIDKWFTLQDIESGRVHMKLQWLSLQTDLDLLRQTFQTTDGCACAMLAVYLDSASNLPKDQTEFSQPDKHGKQPKELKLTRKQNNPNSYVKLSIDQQSQKSKVVYASRDPVFEEYFTFFVHNVESQVLSIQVMVAEKKTLLGTLTLPLLRLLNASDLTLDNRFPLERSGANSQLKIKAILRALKLEKPQPKAPNPPAQPRRGKAPQAKHPESQQTQSQPSHPAPQSSQPEGREQTPRPVPAVVNQTSANPQTSSSSSGLQTETHSQRRGSLLPLEGRRSGPSTPSRMRRYDSHSILSENSLASSRFDLADGVPYPEALMNHQGSFGQIQVTLRYANLRNKLIVTINGCRNLFPCSENGSDTYVRVYLLPEQTWKSRMRTQVKRKTVNPSFEEKFEFSVPMEEARTRKLDVSVKNNRMFHTRERKEIGMVLIDLSQVDLVKGSIDWYELTLPGLKKTN
ncbi:extended synaptotagmin-3 [Electrophorus electricus]|uniref:extended synaptotagmin-3 n=1 Tax=Electrophorus electricus TaxID=8005 RepID=UPI0015D03BEF|nr:extended synaptotagmin-3 [Electrophorus electricus]